MELLSFSLFSMLTGQDFDYATLQKQRLQRIAIIQKKLSPTTKETGKNSQALYNFHPYLGYVGHPDAKPWGELYPAFNHYGVLSVPNHVYPYKKADDEFVIAIVGGSVADIFANYVEDIFNQYVRQQFGFDKKIILINLATGGYKQPQQLFHIQYALLSGFELDAVLNIDGFNDLALSNDNLKHQVNPIFPSGFHIGLLSKIHSSHLDFHTVKRFSDYYSLYETELALLSFVESALLRYSPFLNLTANLWSKQTTQKLKQDEYQLTLKAQETMPDFFRGPQLEIEHNSYHLLAEIWGKSSEMLHAICQQNNLHYFHILQPNQYIDGAKPLSEKEKSIAINVDNSWGITAKSGYDKLIAKGQELKDKGIAFHDLSRIFQDTTEILYVDDCCHFNYEGNLIMGKEIADIIMDTLKEN
ncbi:hypothetical protein [Candidatus Venteria ishoeyi]|uniref:hypothetical protein n=1 Tax=Candidatus Venteria ishoeyi TaxID=1899563 RepID=UPI0011B018DA|nr:hypothetical protein [Candidatus Venteria ishoeyi]